MIFRVLFYILIGYLIYLLIKFFIIVKKNINNYETQTFGAKSREKDISRKAKIIDEKWLDRKKK